jgi:DNA replicative helicase MCM subunit Mcm2 (Cdc46/Mcm family)
MGRRRFNQNTAPKQHEEADFLLEDFTNRQKEYKQSFCSFLEQYYRKEVAQLRQNVLASYGSTSSNGSCLIGRVGNHNSSPHNSNGMMENSQNSSMLFSLRICAQYLLDFNPSLGTLLFRHPDQFLPLFDESLFQEVSKIELNSNNKNNSTERYPFVMGLSPKAKQKLKIRIEFLPPVSELRKPTISAIRSSDVKRLIQLAGTVVRTGMVSFAHYSYLLL